MIVFEKIRYQNFLSIGNNFIEFDLKRHETTLIVGSNGSGKSTLLDALSFGLFGKAYRKINRGQLVNSITGKNCLVEIEFSIGEVGYLIRRGMLPTVFEVYQDGRLLNQVANSRDYQEILEEQILKASHKSFCQIVILGTAAFEPFMKLGAPQRREIIEDLLDLQVFSAMNLMLKESISSNAQELAERTIERDQIAGQLETMKRHAEALEATRTQSLQQKSLKLTLLDQERDEVIVRIKELEEKIAAGKALREEQAELLKKIKNFFKWETEAAAKRDEALKRAYFFTDNEVCEQCTQPIDEEIKLRKAVDFKAEGNRLDSNAGILHEERCRLEDRLEEITAALNQIQDWTLEVSVLRSRKISIGRQMDEIKKDLENLSKSSELVSDIPKTEEALAECASECLVLEDKKKIYSYAALLLKDAGIKSKIIKQYIPIINRLIDKNLHSFELNVNFSIDEHFNETIKSRGCDAFSYESFSQGERQRIDLAILFAWRAVAALRNTINTNILILDEVFDSSLDSSAVEYLMNIIRIHAQTSNIIVISHKDQMHDKFEEIIEFRKVRNFSVMINR